MDKVLETKPAAAPVKSGVARPKPVADKLAKAVSDTYALLIKTHVYHWNVEGPLFFSLHKLTEMQYGELFEAIDEMAERIRALGQLTPMDAEAILAKAKSAKGPAKPTAGEMLAELAADHEALAKSLHELIELAEKHDDPVTADLATSRSAAHEKAVWMLRAHTA